MHPTRTDGVANVQAKAHAAGVHTGCGEGGELAHVKVQRSARLVSNVQLRGDVDGRRERVVCNDLDAAALAVGVAASW